MKPNEKIAVQGLDGKFFRIASLSPSDFMPDRLYHYTSAGGLEGIVSSGVLRASNFSYLNDSTEIQYGQQLAQETILERRNTEKAAINQKVLDCVKKTLKGIGKGLDFYLACFCTEPDLLSQWTGYGSAKGSYCIGFDTENLPPGLDYTISRVLYDQPMQIKKIKDAIDLALETLDNGAGEEFLQCVAGSLTDKIVEELCFFKMMCFEKESEWRAVHSIESTDEIKFDTTGGLIKPFVDLWEGPKNKDGIPMLPIAEVVVGPTAFESLSMKSVELLLARHGYRDIEINKSKVPYRNLG